MPMLAHAAGYGPITVFDREANLVPLRQAIHKRQKIATRAGVLEQVFMLQSPPAAPEVLMPSTSEGRARATAAPWPLPLVELTDVFYAGPALSWRVVDFVCASDAHGKPKGNHSAAAFWADQVQTALQSTRGHLLLDWIDPRDAEVQAYGEVTNCDVRKRFAKHRLNYRAIHVELKNVLKANDALEDSWMDYDFPSFIMRLPPGLTSSRSTFVIRRGVDASGSTSYER